MINLLCFQAMKIISKKRVMRKAGLSKFVFIMTGSGKKLSFFLLFF